MMDSSMKKLGGYKMITKEELGDLRHLILYAKDHYPKKDLLKDLHIISGYISRTNPKYIHYHDIIHWFRNV